MRPIIRRRPISPTIPPAQAATTAGSPPAAPIQAARRRGGNPPAPAPVTLTGRVSGWATANPGGYIANAYVTADGWTIGRVVEEITRLLGSDPVLAILYPTAPGEPKRVLLREDSRMTPNYAAILRAVMLPAPKQFVAYPKRISPVSPPVRRRAPLRP